MKLCHHYHCNIYQLVLVLSVLIKLLKLIQCAQQPQVAGDGGRAQEPNTATEPDVIFEYPEFDYIETPKNVSGFLFPGLDSRFSSSNLVICPAGNCMEGMGRRLRADAGMPWPNRSGQGEVSEEMPLSVVLSGNLRI